MLKSMLFLFSAILIASAGVARAEDVASEGVTIPADSVEAFEAAHPHDQFLGCVHDEHECDHLAHSQGYHHHYTTYDHHRCGHHHRACWGRW